MAKEIERKFLVVDKSYRELATDTVEIKQGYISRDPQRTVRVRIKGSNAYITVKGITEGCTRDEWEFPIDIDDARQMLQRVCQGRIIDKTRYIVPVGQLVWEIDEFHRELSPLVVAEVELPSPDYVIDDYMPCFVGREVTGDKRYYNSMLGSDGSVIPASK
ncbi:MAG: CYTH domain-containing protein [Clostridiales bacterium]|nr:CYTH domain-containing protein [Clostridiales bacterium]